MRKFCLPRSTCLKSDDFGIIRVREVGFPAIYELTVGVRKLVNKLVIQKTNVVDHVMPNDWLLMLFQGLKYFAEA